MAFVSLYDENDLIVEPSGPYLFSRPDLCEVPEHIPGYVYTHLHD